MKPKKMDIIYAVSALVVMVIITGLLNKCEAAEIEMKNTAAWYTELGFGTTKEDNIFCRKDSLNMYGIIHFGYKFNDDMRVQYRHNSCVGKEHDEGSLDSMEIIWDFTPD